MKKIIAAIITVILIASAFSGCGGADKVKVDSDKLQIITTIFPPYDFARQICGDNAQVSMLLSPGSESHSYEPTPQDIIKIGKCDLFIYGGGESDAWVDKILSSLDSRVKTVKMIDCVDALEEEIVEGMQVDEHEHEDEAEEPEYDEHVWTSPKNSIKIAEGIFAAVSEIDLGNSSRYSQGLAVFKDKLTKLDNDYAQFISGLSNKTIIFGDRFPLRYFADEYGLKYYAAFPGCSSETEPSAATLAFLISKVKDEKISTIFYIEASNHLVADNIAEATGAKTAMFHSCHLVSSDELAAGESYISLMEKNLTTLKGALS